jgi:hypothetical protein
LVVIFRNRLILTRFLPFILVLISSVACHGSQDFQANDKPILRSGLITITTHSFDSDVPYPYQIDFSELDRAYYQSGEKITVIQPDLYLSEFDLSAPNGIVDHGKTWRLFCYHPPYDFPIYGTDPQPIINRYRWRYSIFSLIAPVKGYQIELELELCHRYYLKTEEGKTVVLIHVGHYIGGIDRQHFFWSYLGN